MSYCGERLAALDLGDVSRQKFSNDHNLILKRLRRKASRAAGSLGLLSLLCCMKTIEVLLALCGTFGPPVYDISHLRSATVGIQTTQGTLLPRLFALLKFHLLTMLPLYVFALEVNLIVIPLYHRRP
ncbi:hypothetical protein F4804DRAFT_160596 [Jackrogersella minutella]|nr:hypothetical protein F4804DRAFT_160596 [Jackrogersella minutella]